MLSRRQRHSQRQGRINIVIESIEFERDEAVKEFNRAAHDVNNPNKTPEEHAAEMLRLRKKIQGYNARLRNLGKGSVSDA